MPQPGTSARTQLIKTRRGTWVDESLLPAARQERLDLLRAAAREAVGEETYLPSWIASVSGSMDRDVDQLSMERLTRERTPAEEKMAKEIEETVDALQVRGGFEGLAPWEHLEFAMHIRKRIRSKYETRIAREVEEVRKKNPRPKSNPSLVTEKDILNFAIDELHRRGVLEQITHTCFMRALWRKKTRGFSPSRPARLLGYAAAVVRSSPLRNPHTSGQRSTSA